MAEPTVYPEAQEMLPPASASPQVTALPHLPVEIIEQILVLAVRAVCEPCPNQSEGQISARRRYEAEKFELGPHLHEYLSAYLHVLPPAAIPRVVRAVLARMPHCAPVAASGAGRVDILAMRRKLGLWLTEPMASKSLYRPSTCNSALASATRCGHVAVLDWWVRESSVDLDVPSIILHHATVLESQADDPQMLEWWFKSGLLIPFAHGDWRTADSSLTLASQKGHVRILECWRTLGAAYIPENVRVNLDAACFGGHVAVLDWLVASGLPFRYTWQSLQFATKFGHITVLDWWAKSGLKWELPSDLSHVIVHSRSKAVVQWWAPHGFCPSLSDAELAAAARDEQFDVLEYWAWMTKGLKSHDRAPGLKRKVSLLVREACAYGCVDVLDWLVKRGIPLLCVEGVDSATENGHVAVLEWWKRVGMSLTAPSLQALEKARTNGHVKVVKWWRESGLQC
ncbi:hypothetical protein AMAG_13632 [Allomyces macrogynus ATCC 38327]|uniref:Uncharacterized protein n=1 Tax=Allomyces macrogynus (strain ATCC 38327) TaxID=578462 RepID=A0A0L0T3W3_ALLM3|nr:hypothetical protein AMAG_13632 [Allomyces macrogynus ATCC 38327]|eukprot:KNE69249.1 hypothetical protein AMAG_13632 [Allomyces macrogynus ATCC 38327]